MNIVQVYPESLQAPASYCKYFFRCEQSAGDVDNLVVSGAQAIKNTGFLDATLWATAGYATVGAAAANYCTLAASTHDLTLDGMTLVFTVRVKKAAAAYPGAEQYIVASYAPGTNNGGIILSCRTDGAARLYMNAADGTVASVSTDAGVITNGTTANERSLVFFAPREGGSAWSHVDAIEDNSGSIAAIAGKSLAGGRSMQIGAPLGGGSIDGYQIAALAAYLVPKNLSAIDRNQVADWALRHPGVAAPDWVFE